MPYEWRQWDDSPEFGSKAQNWVGLLPIDEPNNYSLSRIASVYRNGRGMYSAAYFYPQSTGNQPADGALFKTLRGAQRWIERQLAKFWEPPAISNRVS